MVQPVGLTPEALLEMYRLMALSRAFCELVWLLQRGGRTAFVVTGEGHEALQVASVCALQRGKDFFVPYYRDLAVAVAAGMTPRGNDAELSGESRRPEQRRPADSRPLCGRQATHCPSVHRGRGASAACRWRRLGE